MTYIRTYLEMTSPEELRPGREVDGVALLPISDRPELVRELLVRIGTPYGWRSAKRSDADWAAEFAKPGLRSWAVTHHGEEVGLVDLIDQPPEVELYTFGLVPEAVGRGIGGHALTLALRQAWSLRDGVTRVWLHTSTQDHPNALRNYQARGLRPYDTDEQD